ncbi:hypothetical protein SprV_0501942800 [Sparganum proliferum]
MNLFAAAAAAAAAAACENFGLVSNSEKTAVIHQPPPNTTIPSPQCAERGDYRGVTARQNLPPGSRM